MDADDECDINRIQEQINFINNTSFKNLGVVSTYRKYINYKNKIIANRFSGPTNIKTFDKMNSKNENFSIKYQSLKSVKRVMSPSLFAPKVHKNEIKNDVLSPKTSLAPLS